MGQGTTKGTYSGEYASGLKFEYEGDLDWIGLPHGEGTEINEEGGKYVGGFKDGLKHGKGIA